MSSNVVPINNSEVIKNKRLAELNNKEMYSVVVVAKTLPHRGFNYDDVHMNILRQEPVDINTKGLIKGDEDGYSNDLISRQFFTGKETKDLIKHFEKTYGENIKEIITEKINFPIDSDIAPSDAVGYGGGTDGYMFYEDDNWKGLNILGFYDVYEVHPVSSYVTYRFDSKGNASGGLNLDSSDMKKIIEAYKEAVNTGKETTYTITKDIKKQEVFTGGNNEIHSSMPF